MCILHNYRDTSQTSSGIGVTLDRTANVEPYENDEESYEPVTEIEITTDNEKEINQQPCYDKFTHKKVTLQRYNLMKNSKVKGRTLSH